MADSSIVVKDATGLNRELATDLTGSQHTTKTIVVSGCVTDEQIRATPLSVVGPATDAEMRATPLNVAGPLTNTEIRATPLSVVGPATDAEMRATPLNVAGPLTDAQLRAAAVGTTEKNSNEAPKTCGVFAVAAAALLGPITVPAGSTGVRLYAVTKNVVFRTDVDPAVPAADTLGAGGVAIAGQLRVYRFPAAVTDLRIRSTEAGGGASTDVVVEFFGT